MTRNTSTGLVVSACIALWSLFHAMGVLRLALASKNWPTTEGKIIASNVIRRREHTREGHQYRSDLEIYYSYSVDNQSYTRQRVFFGDTGYFSELFVDEYGIVRRYPAGRTVDVHYDPNDPGRSALEPGLCLANLAWWPLSVISAFGGIFFWRRGRRAA